MKYKIGDLVKIDTKFIYHGKLALVIAIVKPGEKIDNYAPVTETTYQVLIPGMKHFKPWLVEEQLREINEQ